MLMLDFRDYGWWYWVASTISLWFALAGFNGAYEMALMIGAAQLLHFIYVERHVGNFPVQIRMGYLSFLLLALPEGLQWLLWVPAVGTLLRVLTGYCIMARMLMLMPFNREVQLSAEFVTAAFLTPPVAGNILHGLPARK